MLRADACENAGVGCDGVRERWCRMPLWCVPSRHRMPRGGQAHAGHGRRSCHPVSTHTEIEHTKKPSVVSAKLRVLLLAPVGSEWALA
eukprot:994088-Rhodomonas_salina.1